MNALLKCTPEKWAIEERMAHPSLRTPANTEIECIVRAGTGNTFAIVQLGGRGATSMQPDDIRANASLISAAYDHALVASTLASGKLRWEPATNELCFNRIRRATELDPFGVPRLSDGLRAALLLVLESEQ
jgi:hypothetical protein